MVFVWTIAVQNHFYLISAIIQLGITTVWSSHEKSTLKNWLCNHPTISLFCLNPITDNVRRPGDL